MGKTKTRRKQRANIPLRLTTIKLPRTHKSPNLTNQLKKPNSTRLTQRRKKTMAETKEEKK